jgi:predicted metal-dependent peptidase
MTKKSNEHTHEEQTADVKEYKRDPNKDYSYIKKLVTVFFAQETFYGRILSRFIIKEDWECNSAYVKFDYPFYLETGRITYLMGFNPEFIDSELCRKYEKNNLISISHHDDAYKEAAFVFVHEVLHTILGHLTDRTIISKDKTEMEVANIAMDLAINSLILKSRDEIEAKSREISLIPPKLGFYPGKKPQIKNQEFASFIETLPALQTTTFYFNKIKEYMEKEAEKKGDEKGQSGETNKVKVFLNGLQQSDGSSESIGFDSHNGWSNLPKEIREEIKSNMRNQIKEALNEARKSNRWGTVSSSMQELMGRLVAESPVDWKTLIENVVGQCRVQEHEGTYKKLSKKLPMLLPGEKKKTSMPIAFFIDQSGSMTNEDVQLAFAQAANCAAMIEIDVYNFDTEVDEKSHVVWKNKFSYTWKRTRDGGTDFNAIKRFIENPSFRKRNWKWIVILTDGYAPSLDPLPAKVLWLITPGGKEPENLRPQDLVAKMKHPKDYDTTDVI